MKRKAGGVSSLFTYCWQIARNQQKQIDEMIRAQKTAAERQLAANNAAYQMQVDIYNNRTCIDVESRIVEDVICLPNNV